MEMESLCEMALDEAKAKRLEKVISDNYWYQLYIDDLPVWGFLGEHTTSIDGILPENVQSKSF